MPDQIEQDRRRVAVMMAQHINFTLQDIQVYLALFTAPHGPQLSEELQLAYQTLAASLRHASEAALQLIMGLSPTNQE